MISASGWLFKRKAEVKGDMTR